MKKSIAICKKRQIWFCLPIILLSACKQKATKSNNESNIKDTHRNNVSMLLTSIAVVDSTQYYSEGNNILVKVEITNNSNSAITIGSFDYDLDNNGTKSLFQQPIRNSISKSSGNVIGGFYLISKNFKSGAVKLISGAITVGGLSESKHTETIVLWTNFEYLRFFLLSPVPKDEKIAYNNVIKFFREGNYSLIYVSPNDSLTCIAEKSKTFNIKTTNRLTDELKNTTKS